MRKSKTLLLLLLSALTLLCGCVTPLEHYPGEETSTPTTESSHGGIVSVTPPEVTVGAPQKGEVYTYRTAVNEETLDTSLDPRYLLLVNKQSPLTMDYVPSELVKLTCHTTYEMELELRAAMALYEMFDEMSAYGLDVKNDIAVTSAYRSYRLQGELFEEYVDFEKNHPDGFSADARNVLGYYYIRTQYEDKGIFKLSDADARRVVAAYSAEAGKSEHQTGLCVDLITADMKNNLTVVFEEKPVFAWLSQHAHEFGFILRYPKGKEDVTGYTYEPWHYRFVGREAATEMHELDMTLEEYLLHKG